MLLLSSPCMSILHLTTILSTAMSNVKTAVR